MKRRSILLIVFSIFAMLTTAFAGVPGDVNGDSKITLEDVIYALQVIAGIRPPVTLDFLTISPSNPAIPLGETQPFTIVGTYSNATTQDLTSVVTWTSSIEAVATISNENGSRGLANAVAIGSTTITATDVDTSKAISTTLTVTYPPYSTADATSVTDSSAVLNGSFNNAPGDTTTVWFEYGTNTSYGSTSAQQGYANVGDVSVSIKVSGLNSLMTYHYVIVIQNSTGTYYGNDMTFTTYETPQIIVSGENIGYTLIGVDEAYIYYASFDGNNSYIWTIAKIGISGGTPLSLVTGLPNDFRSFAMDQQYIYWTENGTIKKIDKNGSSIMTVASGIGRGTASPSMVLDATSVYWTDMVSDPCPDNAISCPAVKKVDKAGGTITTLASGTGPMLSYSLIGADATSVYFTETDVSTVTLKKTGINGGIVVALASGFYYPTGFVGDATNIYYFEKNNFDDSYAAIKISVTGGDPFTIASGFNDAPSSSMGTWRSAIDNSSVFWLGINGYYNALNKVSIDGGAVTIYTSQLKTYDSIVLDSSNVYWTEWDNSIIGGAIVKMQK